jgi:serine/threonine protein kinase
MILSVDMPDEQWRLVREILYKALELPPQDRGAYVDSACGSDPVMRAEVQSLLDASEKQAVIDRPVLSFPTVTMTIETPEPSLLVPGQTLSHYEILQKVGEGGMGEVYKAIDQQLGRTVALKVIRDAGKGRHARERFAREAKAASALNHPNIVTIYEFASADSLEFIAMEYVEGVTLDRLGRQPLHKVLGYLRQIAGALAKAHAAGIVHRDLKPGNIMVTPDGIAKILDFGLAKRQASSDPGETGDLTLTQSGALIGTPAYMAPEQILGDPVGPPADIFSFGVILYELAMGQRPFKAKTALGTLDQVAHWDPPVSTDALPPALTSLIRSCLKKSPAERPESFVEIARILDSIPAHEPARPSRRAWLLAPLVGISVILAGGLIMLHRQVPVPSLTYSIEMQQPGGQPYIASAADTFQAGWKFRLRIQPPGPGFLYVVNQGPGENGSDRFWILSQTSVETNKEVATGGFVFDRNPGTERVWIVWASRKIPDLETGGEVQDSARALGIRDILTKLQKRPVPAAGLAVLAELRHQ